MAGKYVQVGDIMQIGEDILRAARIASEHTARRTPGFITKNARQGLKPDGTPQPSLAPSTVESKRKKGQPATPGVATGQLVRASSWMVRANRKVGYYILPPPESQEYLPYLEAKGFVFLEFPPESVKFLERRLQEEVDKVK